MMKKKEEERFDNPIYSSYNCPMVFTEGDRESLRTPCNRSHLSGCTWLRRNYKCVVCVVLLVGCIVTVLSLNAQKHSEIEKIKQSNKETCEAEKEELKNLQSENYTVLSENYRDLLNMILKQDGWKYINSSLYYISTETKSWDDSRPYCQRKGLDLAIINSEEEQAFLIEVVSAKQLDGVWIGLSPNTKEMSTRRKRGAQQEDCAKLRVYETPAVKEVTGEQCGTQKYCICEKYLINKM